MLNRQGLLCSTCRSARVPRSIAKLFIPVLCNHSNQPETRQLSYQVFSQVDGLVVCVMSYFVKSAVTGTADEVEFSALVEAGHLETAWSVTFTLSVD